MFYLTFKEKLTPILLKFFKKKKVKRREHFLPHSMRLTAKPDKEPTGKVQSDSPYGAKLLKKKASKPNSAAQIIQDDQVGYILEYSMVQHMKINQCNANT